MSDGQDGPTAPVPSDYELGDGWDSEKGLDVCPVCERLYSGNGGYLGAVYTTDGTRYDHVLDTDPGDGPFICERCYNVLDANQKRMEHTTLDQFELMSDNE